MNKIVQVTLRFEVPAEVSTTDAGVAAARAVSQYGAQLRPPGAYGSDDPGDPMFGARRVELTSVRRLRANRRIPIVVVVV